MSKKIILIVSGVLGAVFLFTIYYIEFRCKLATSTCSNFLEYLWMNTITFLPIFIFSIITYFLNEQTFVAWRKFTLWWVLASFIIIAIAPTEDNFFGNIKELTALFSAGGYALFATILILYRSYKLRGK